jgi:hypothetical protein
VQYAESATTSGNGTLTFAIAGTTLAWKAQGDAVAGAPVDVSGGGTFTLQSGTASHSIVVTVTASALPVGNQNDADIAVSSTLKAHIFPFNLTDRPSALLELGHTDTGKYYRTLGAKLNTLSYDLVAPEQNIALGVIAGVETEETAAWDAAPTAYDAVRAYGAGGLLGNGVDAALGAVVGGSVSVANGMTGKPLADGVEGYGLIDQGEVVLGGKLNTVFDSGGAYALARASTSTRLRLASTASVGSATFGLYWDIPNAEFVEKVVPKEGKSGLFVELEWNAHRVAGGALPVVVLVNDVASY